MPKFPLTWIVIADGRSSHAWECKEKNGGFTPVPDLSGESADSQGFSRDLKSDRPGRAFSTAGGGRSTIEPHHDPHDLAKHDFVQQLAVKLNAACLQKRFVRLILAAPPKLLGVLRDELDAPARAAVAAEFDKDLVKANLAQIQELAAPYLTVPLV